MFESYVKIVKRVFKMKDRNIPCIYYTCAGGICKKNFKDVTLKKCKNCAKYKPRKLSKRPENIKIKKRKDRDRHDNWKTNY